MKNTIFRPLLLVGLLIVSHLSQAQTATFDKVLSIFETNCSSAYCHGGTHPLVLNADAESVYDALVDMPPFNYVAEEAGYKLVAPGYPDKSFLFKKINNGLYHQTGELDASEGSSMPSFEMLSEVDIEIIRQWILFGADAEDEDDQETAIADYYEGDALAQIEPLEPPAAGDGFQLYFGRLFLEPGEEREYVKKHELPLGDSLEVKAIEVRMNDFSHHLAIAKIHDEVEDDIEEGTTRIDNILGSFEFFTNSTIIAVAQAGDHYFDIPENTAFSWEPDPFIYINYHVKNYSSSGVLPAEVYINVYTQPKGQAEFPLTATPITYGFDNPFLLNIEPTGTDTTFTMEWYDPESTDDVNITLLTPHAHALCVDFDMFKRNADGTKGEQVFEGHYNADYTANVGYFDHSNPPYRNFDPPLIIKESEGLIIEGTFNNDGDEAVGFGLTTDDEMFVTYTIFYRTPEAYVGIEDEFLELEQEQKDELFRVAPNPVLDQLRIDYEITQTDYVRLLLTDLTGRELLEILARQKQQAGTHSLNVSLKEKQLPKGIYALVLQKGNQKQQLQLLKVE